MLSVDVDVTKALANERRLQILHWLKRPRRHFPPQKDGDLVRDGVCGLLIADKLGISAPTASEHLKILTQAGLIRPKRIKQWIFYTRDERRIAAVKRAFPMAVFDHSTEPMFEITLVKVPRRTGWRLQFALDVKTGRVTLIGLPTIQFCD